MRAFALSFAAVFLLTMPIVSFAATPLGGPLVPQCNSVFQGACGFCDLFQLTQNLINFAVGFAVIVATLMFVYAGVLYFSASAKQDNIKKAHGIFWKVFIGFVFVLSAWLIVDLIMSTFLGKDFGPWNQLNCSASSSVRSVPFAPAGGITLPSPTTGSGSAPQQVAFPAPTSGPISQRWCLEVDGKTDCSFTNLSGCKLAYGVAERRGLSVSACSSQQFQEPPENTSAPQEASLDEPTTEPDNSSGAI